MPFALMPYIIPCAGVQPKNEDIEYHLAYCVSSTPYTQVLSLSQVA